jgi:two-component system, NarL family, nitrate/nitrite response regulator NarL
MGASIRVVIIHPSRLLREGLAFALDRGKISVVAARSSVEELWPQLAELDPHVFVLDLGLPSRDGLAHARALNQAMPLAAIVMMGLGDLEGDVVACCEAGATGFLLRDASLQDVGDHVQAVANGEAPVTPRIAALLSARLRDRARELQRLHRLGTARLTRRELEVIRLIDEHLSNKEIASRMNIEPQTVKNHVHNILEKLELHGRYAAVRYAREHGLLRDLPDAQARPKPRTS